MRLNVFFKYNIFLPKNSLILGRNIIIGEKFSLNSGCMIYSQDKNGKSEVKIGNRVSLNHNVMINSDNGGKIIIGDDVLIGPGVIFRSSNHKFSDNDRPINQQGHIPGKIVVEKNVWLGANVVVLPGAFIHEGSIIAAGSVVNKEVEAFSIYGGIPAKKLKSR